MTEKNNTKVHNVVIIGSGPAGYTAGVYTARGDLEPVLFAGSVTAGGDLMNTTEVENFPGFPESVNGPVLMEKMQAQAEKFGTEVIFDDVKKVDLTVSPKVITLENGEEYKAKTVIISTGSQYNKLNISGEDEMSGHGISWCATCDGFFFRNKEVAVVGGGDSALEEAIFLTKFANKVFVIVRREELRASAIMQDRAQDNPKIEFIWNTEVDKLLGNEKLESLSLKNNQNQEISELEIDGLFIAIGSSPRTDLVKGQVDLNDDGTVAVTGRTTHTSLPGVFAAGDVIDNHYRQAVTAVGSGAMAAIDVENYLQNNE